MYRPCLDALNNYLVQVMLFLIQTITIRHPRQHTYTYMQHVQLHVDRYIHRSISLSYMSTYLYPDQSIHLSIYDGSKQCKPRGNGSDTFNPMSLKERRWGWLGSRCAKAYADEQFSTFQTKQHGPRLWSRELQNNILRSRQPMILGFETLTLKIPTFELGVARRSDPLRRTCSPGSSASARPIRKGTNGVSTNGVTAISMFFLTQRLFGYLC